MIKSGLKAGEKLIVTGVQKIGDGAPVQASAPAPPPGNPSLPPPSPRAAERANSLVLRRLHPPSHPGDGLLLRDHPRGGDLHPASPHRPLPRAGAPLGERAGVYTGANAQAVESAVTTPLEQVINGVEGMTYMQSSSTNSGATTINVYFDIGRDPDLAAVDVQNRVNQALGRLPADVRTTGVTVTKNTTGFMGGLGFYSKDNRYTAQFISNYLDLFVRDALKRVPGVGNVIIFGERKYAMRLWLDPSRLAARQITAGDVVDALREQNLQVAAGALGDAPADPTRCTTSASAPWAASPSRSSSRTSFSRPGPTAPSCGFAMSAGWNWAPKRTRRTFASSVSKPRAWASSFCPRPTRSRSTTAYEGMGRLEKSFPPGLEWRLAFDNVGVVRESIIEVLYHALRGHRSRHPRDVPVPPELAQHDHPGHHDPRLPVGTFAFVKLFGFSINTLTLFGIVLATGIVVDDAIVVIENIERHMREEKKSSIRAAIDAMREVFSAVVVIGLVLVAVFVPVAFFPGTTGRLYQQFSLTIAFAVVLSVFNAVTFTPALSALMLARQSHVKGRFFSGVNRVIEAGTNGYVRLLRRALSMRPVMIVLFLVSIGATCLALPNRSLGVRSRRGRGLLHQHRPGSRGRFAGVQHQYREAGRSRPVQGPRHRGGVFGHGLQLQRRGAEPGAHLHAAQAVREAARARTIRWPRS